MIWSELDRECAEKIMNLRIKTDDGNTYWVEQDGSEPHYHCHFSTDLESATVVADEILNRAKGAGAPLKGTYYTMVRSSSGWAVGFHIGPWGLELDDPNTRGIYKHRGYSGKAKDESLPKAICMAALNALKFYKGEK